MLIFVYGSDGVRVSEKVEEMRKRFLQKFDASGMNLAEFPTTGSSELPFGDIVQAVQSAPFLSEKRMVIVRGLLMTLKKAQSDVWIDALRRTPSSSIVVLADCEDAKAIEKHAVFVGCKDMAETHHYAQEKLEGDVLVRWVVERAKEHGATISRDVAAELAARVGDDVWRLRQEIAKLAAYAGKESITRVAIDMLVMRDSASNIFALVDALAGNDAKTALRMLADERAAGSADLYILAMIARQVRLLAQVKTLTDGYASVDKGTVAKKLSMHPFVAQKTLAQAKCYTFVQIFRLHGLITQMDRDAKRGRVDSALAVDRIVTDMLLA